MLIFSPHTCSCLLAVLDMLSASSLAYFFLVKRLKYSSIFYSLPKQLKIIPRSSRTTVQNLSILLHTWCHFTHFTKFFKIWSTLVEVPQENDYYGKLNITIVKGSIGVISNFQFTVVKFILVNFHDYGGENKDDPSPITIGFTKKI